MRKLDFKKRNRRKFDAHVARTMSVWFSKYATELVLGNEDVKYFDIYEADDMTLVMRESNEVDGLKLKRYRSGSCMCNAEFWRYMVANSYDYLTVYRGADGEIHIGRYKKNG